MHILTADTKGMSTPQLGESIPAPCRQSHANGSQARVPVPNISVWTLEIWAGLVKFKPTWAGGVKLRWLATVSTEAAMSTQLFLVC